MLQRAFHPQSPPSTITRPSSLAPPSATAKLHADQEPPSCYQDSHSRAFRGLKPHQNRTRIAMLLSQQRETENQATHARIPPVHTACDPVVEQRGLPLMPTPRIRRICDAGRNPADIHFRALSSESDERSGRRGLSRGSCPALIDRRVYGNPASLNPTFGEVAGP